MKTIHIFDLDDTLMITPTYADMLRSGKEDSYLTEFLNALQGAFALLFFKSINFSSENHFIYVIDNGKGEPMSSSFLLQLEQFVLDVETKFKPEDVKKHYGVSRGFIRSLPNILGEKNGKLILEDIKGFHSDSNTLGTVPNEPVHEKYKMAQNKMILTGRSNKMKSEVVNSIKEAGMDLPNHGVFCFDGKGSIDEFKSRIIEDKVKEGFDEIHFYEDREDWLEKAYKDITQRYPQVQFHKHYVDNVKKSKGFE